MMRRGLTLIAALLAGLAAAPKNAAQIDALLNSLKAAPDDQAATSLEQRLREAWRAAGSPASTLLLDRAGREMSGSPDAAVEDADAALVLDPDSVHGFVVRGAARLANGDPVGAARDAAEALKREPREIDALVLLSHAAEQRDDAPAAYGAWQRLMELDPKRADGEQRLRDLRRKAVGENI